MRNGSQCRRLKKNLIVLFLQSIRKTRFCCRSKVNSSNMGRELFAPSEKKTKNVWYHYYEGASFMKSIVIGGGKVGYYLVKTLKERKYDAVSYTHLRAHETRH